MGDRWATGARHLSAAPVSDRSPGLRVFSWWIRHRYPKATGAWRQVPGTCQRSTWHLSAQAPVSAGTWHLSAAPVSVLQLQSASAPCQLVWHEPKFCELKHAETPATRPFFHPLAAKGGERVEEWWLYGG